MTQLPRDIRLLRNATLASGERVDVQLDGDTVARVAPAGTLPVDGEVLELDGFVLLTAPAEPHAHLDKALSFDLIAPPMGDLGLAIRSWQQYSAVMTIEQIADRARTAALALLRSGTTAIRCHVDMLLGDEPLRGVHALVQVREELRDLIDIELVALAGWQATDATVEAALDAGVDLVGGAPHLAPEPLADIRRLLAIAERRGVGVDLHTDEALTGEPTIVEFARTVRDWKQNATAGHCVRLGTLPADELETVIDEVLAADLGIVTLPITNLYLQGWEHPVSTPRGLTAVRRLIDRGARLGAGADNVRDPFNPVGRSDALETASLLVTAGHLTLDEAYRLVGDGARAVMGLPLAGPIPGARAELLAVRGTGLGDVIATAPADRYVIHRGRLVAQTEVHSAVATPAPLLGTLGTR
ncbi:amidohydrolase family protein [Herbiconiux sp. SYSU D00978]|uniref:amidohydrolase family protein n=1 Tax=Herbiconiux sp. SYSU D00978 TaxID=2812562 RepID=UPI0027DDF24C|nr:amidohydrolase family protein [Herbiconiux sp. SYSU D00978]